jgi:hypothetical protein
MSRQKLSSIMAAFSTASRLDAVNIGLMLVSCAVAFLVPFELFLFSYAVLGPLHYLTEISWLHDKNYYTKSRWDAMVLLIIGLVLTLTYFNGIYGLGFDLPDSTFANLVYVAFFGALVMVFVKNRFYRIAGLVLIALSYGLSKHFAVFLTVFLPTLIHVYVFTGLFMLYGALKSKSKLGLISVAVLIICPILLFTLFPDFKPFGPTTYGRDAYIGLIPGNDERGPVPVGFIGLNQQTLGMFFGMGPQDGTAGFEYWLDAVFSSKAGILLMRFIAFAYTYHYLNWFSKTRIIQWHKVSKARFAIVLLFWVASLGVYFYNYALGLQWLFFLSFLHVLLEFPLNYVSIAGIGQAIRSAFSGGGKGGTPIPAGAATPVPKKGAQPQRAAAR